MALDEALAHCAVNGLEVELTALRNRACAWCKPVLRRQGA